METIEKRITVDVPVRAVYDQWTQFEDFPQFMEGVKEVRQQGDKRLHWVTDVGGKRQEFDADIIEQLPDQVIAWESTVGVKQAGRVVFTPDAQGTRITLRMAYEPRDAMESVGSRLGILDRQVQGDLERFKRFMEERRTPTGAWRGRIEEGQVISERETSGPR
ncbi:MAG: SRPBCC family protein [Chloroflexota bacterium]|nr:SRPBCC family protein [Chloroflexota bacterium]